LHPEFPGWGFKYLLIIWNKPAGTQTEGNHLRMSVRRHPCLSNQPGKRESYHKLSKLL
jgi:hypothetical protein